MNKIKNNDKSKLRYNIISAIVYIIGIILLIQLFNLQIVKGQEYREQSNTRLTRETVIQAARGSISDRTGTSLATTKSAFSLEIYKTKIDTETLNETLLKMVNVLEENGDKYTDSFPITINPFTFTLADEESQNSWKKSNSIDEGKTAEECFYIFKDKYKITNDDIEEVRKIIVVRYYISKNGYSSTKPVQISSNLSDISVAQFNERRSEFPGLYVTQNPTRTYAFGSLASHILGTIGKIKEEELATRKDTYSANDYIGKTGIEYIFEEYLKGTNGVRQVDMAVDGTVTAEYVAEEAIAGSDVILTIDAKLQQVTETALKNNIQKIASGGFSDQSDANAGAVVVMNVKTGEVLAMASYPDYEPELFASVISTEKWNEYNNDKATPLINRSIYSAYAPGSTFKMITAIAGLESGVITTTETINDTGVYPYLYNPVCWLWTSSKRGHGRLNVSDAIKHSCNYFFYELGYRMGIDTLSSYANYFGLGKKTGIELPSENSGSVASREYKSKNANGERWYDGETLSAAIGQSYNNFTPIQMAKYISMLSNGGNPIDVTIVKSIINADGTEVPEKEYEQFVNEKLGLTNEETDAMDIKEGNIKAVLEGMRGVTSESGGTAYSIFKNFNIEVGGKTGSAEVSNGTTNAWFVGFAPFDNPEIAIVVVVENGGHGSYTAEVARDIIAEYFGMNAGQVTEDMTAVSTTEIRR